MQHIVTANDFSLAIGKQRESVAPFLRLPPINLRRINADANYADPARVKIRKAPLKTPQLGVAKRSTDEEAGPNRPVPLPRHVDLVRHQDGLVPWRAVAIRKIQR